MRVFLLALVFSTTALAATPSLKQREDPFYLGPSAEFTLSGTSNSQSTNTATVLQGQYGWDTGVSIQLLVPVLLSDSNPANPNNTFPRIGGGPNGRVEADGLFRAWGDTYDYLGFNVGVGFPWQSTTVAQNGDQDSWLLALAVFGRVDWDWIAFEGRLNDSPSFPAKHAANNVEIYQDVTNTVSITGTAYVYPYRWLAPFLAYTEVFPSSVNTSFDQGLGYFTLNQTSIGRTRTVTVGSDIAPINVPMLLTFEFNLTPLTPNAPGTQYSGVGRVRWLF